MKWIQVEGEGELVKAWIAGDFFIRACRYNINDLCWALVNKTEPVPNGYKLWRAARYIGIYPTFEAADQIARQLQMKTKFKNRG